jgi:hypothetical protein
MKLTDWRLMRPRAILRADNRGLPYELMTLEAGEAHQGSDPMRPVPSLARLILTLLLLVEASVARHRGLRTGDFCNRCEFEKSGSRLSPMIYRLALYLTGTFRRLLRLLRLSYFLYIVCARPAEPILTLAELLIPLYFIFLIKHYTGKLCTVNFLFRGANFFY